jgi:peptidyl-prolyl cis-trans isomerase SurA
MNLLALRIVIFLSISDFSPLLKAQGVNVKEITRCKLMGKLMEDKLYAHHAIQDSIIVSDAEITDYVNNAVNYFVNQIGSIEKVLEYYKKEDEETFRQDLFEINKIQKLATKMQDKIVEEVEITPEEVRDFFKKIPVEERPQFGAELEIAQIIIEPKVPKAVEDKVVAKLKEIRKDIVENGVSFRTQAVLYSQDKGSSSRGGFYPLTKKTPFAKELKDTAYRLLEGEVSEPFKTDFGWHIVTVDKIRGQELDIRHILLTPEVPSSELAVARKKIDSVRTAILKKEISFAEAALQFSDEKETRQNGGLLINPATFDTKFDLTKMDPTLYQQVQALKDDEMSLPLIDEGRTGNKKYKILKVTNRFDAHTAEFSKDYIKIKDLALKEKQLEAVRKWMREKIEETYISVGNDYADCTFTSNWLKK